MTSNIGTGTASAGLARRSLLTRALEGTHPWGIDQIGTSDRYGWQQSRLTVYPPGTSSAERRRLTFLRNWPLAGGLLCLVLVTTLGSAFSPVLVTSAAIALWTAGIAAGILATRRIRPRVRRVSAAVIRVDGRDELMGDHDLLRDSRRRFAVLDRLLASGEITPVRYEAEWATVYGRLGGDSTPPSGTNRYPMPGSVTK